ncbi:MBL fold metallo-hydrolase [Tumebacillus lipolyticus]|uniref:MBL fold metallo-hydrolase n=1 Tax=Tumebacillus lipolyticus TaxID=1280370 RepID=A0ABW5A0R9_9BACL
MKLRVLGETGPYPAPGGATTGFLLSTDQGNVLIDCGSGVLAELTKHIRVADLDAVIITHHHADHISDLNVLQYAVMIHRLQGLRQEPITVYANGAPAIEFEKVGLDGHVAAVPLSKDSTLELCGMKFTFADTNHAIPCLAVSAEHAGKRFVFSGDSGPSPSLEQLAAGADFFLCEASWLEQDKGPAEIGHLTAKEVGEIGKRVGVKQLCLTHFYPEYDRSLLQQEAAAEFGRDVLIAKQGDVYDIV